MTWESEEGYLTTLSSLLARRLSDGARACTVDLKLRSDADASFDLLATVTGCNPETGEGTVGYVWRVRKQPLRTRTQARFPTKGLKFPLPHALPICF